MFLRRCSPEIQWLWFFPGGSGKTDQSEEPCGDHASVKNQNICIFAETNENWSPIQDFSEGPTTFPVMLWSLLGIFSTHHAEPDSFISLRLADLQHWPLILRPTPYY